jgi:hypothetical protein
VAVAVTSCETKLNYSAARVAAEWVKAFYPDIAISLDGDGVCLASSERGEQELQLIWRSAVANEALLARGAPERADLIEALVR